MYEDTRLFETVDRCALGCESPKGGKEDVRVGSLGNFPWIVRLSILAETGGANEFCGNIGLGRKLLLESGGVALDGW